MKISWPLGRACLFAGLWCAVCGCTSPFTTGVLKRSDPPASTGDTAVQLTDAQKIEIQVALARTLERQGDFERAQTIYRTVLERAPRHLVANHRLAVLLDQQMKFEESAPLFQKALKQSPNDTVIRGDYAFSLYRQSKWYEAEKELRRVIEIDPGDKRAHTHLGLVLAQTGRVNEALAEFQEAGCTPEEAQENLLVLAELNGLPEEIGRTDQPVRRRTGSAGNRLDSESGSKLTWSGPGDEETIPVSLGRPAHTGPSEDPVHPVGAGACDAQGRPESATGGRTGYAQL